MKRREPRILMYLRYANAPSKQRKNQTMLREESGAAKEERRDETGRTLRPALEKLKDAARMGGCDILISRVPNRPTPSNR